MWYILMDQRNAHTKYAKNMLCVCLYVFISASYTCALVRKCQCDCAEQDELQIVETETVITSVGTKFSYIPKSSQKTCVLSTFFFL